MCQHNMKKKKQTTVKEKKKKILLPKPATALQKAGLGKS